MGVSVFNQSGPFELPGMSVAPTGGEKFYVGATMPVGQIGEKIVQDRFYTSVNAALAACVSGRGDTIMVLPGYTENITADAWSNLAATDVTVQGLGRGTNRPTFTWTANGATVLFDTANFRVLNVRMFMAGPQSAGAAQTTAAPITVSAAGCEISGCEIWWGFDADQIVTIGITTTAAADNFTFNSNFCYAETAAVPTTTFLRLTGTDNLRMDGTVIIGPGSTTSIGPVQQLTTGSLKVWIHDCVFQSTLAASTIAFTAIAGCTGTVDKCSFGVLAAGNGLTAASGMQVTNSKTAVGAAAGADTTG